HEYPNLRLALPQRVFGRPFVRDVPADADHANRAAGLEKDLAAGGDPTLSPVARPSNPIFGYVDAVAGRVERRLQCRFDLWDVFGQSGPEYCLGVDHGSGLKAEDASDRVHVFRRVLFNVEIE